VRIFTSPYAGRVGKLRGILADQIRLPSGVRTNAAVVELESGTEKLEEATIPLANMDVIE